MASPQKSLTVRINETISSIGELDRTAIKALLVRFAKLAKALEDGTAARKAKSKITRLQTALEKAETVQEESAAALEQSNAELGNLKSELQTMQAEIAQYQAERKKQEEREREIAPIQFEILERLGSPATCDWLNLGEISRALKIPVDEAEIYIEGLDGLGLVFYHPHEPGGGGWLRTADGNRRVVAKRWASEEGDQKQRECKYADLPKAQHDALLIIAANVDGISENEIAKKLGMTRALTRRHLYLLRDAEMATDAEEPGSPILAWDSVTGEESDSSPTWNALRKGSEYLAERDLL
ncbi:MAG: hypothetical protein QOD12_1786 [Verrucomicrobiota bacterium]|jgi:DNA-binding transcriptional ArsR family regulator